MSFEHWLPWQVYVILMLGASAMVLVHVKKKWTSEPAAHVASLLLFGIGGLIIAIAKIGNWQIYYQDKIPLGTILDLIMILGFILLIIGGYQKLKNNPEKLKRLFKYFVIWIIVLAVLYALFIVSLKL